MTAVRSFVGVALALALASVAACFTAPSAAVQFSCDPASAPECPPDYSCEADGCCHRMGSDVQANLGSCRLDGGVMTGDGPTGSGTDPTSTATDPAATDTDVTATDTDITATDTDPTATDGSSTTGSDTDAPTSGSSGSGSTNTD